VRHNQQLKDLPILTVVFIIAGLLLTACGGGQETYTIGVINLSPNQDVTVKGFQESMTELGYVEGKNITYIYEGATGNIDKLDSVAQSLVAADVDLILSITTPATQAAQRATAGTDIPVVFVPVTDPVGAGIVDSLRNPGGNITGITFGAQEARRLKWLIQVAPSIEQIYIPYNPEDQSAVLALETVREAATELDVELITREARNPEEVDAIFLLPDSVVGAHTTEFVELQLPTSAPNPKALETHGILTSYGWDQTAAGKQAAGLADQIFHGIKSADLPVETAEFYSAINLKTAEAIGLDIPDEILLQADIIVR
jgi:putative ABC transport system substrate-binding protein